MRYIPASSSCAIVMIGDFTPSLYTPAWLALNDLIEVGESESANIENISKQAAVFSLSWANFAIYDDRFQILSNIAPWVRLQDLTVKLFGEITPHQPVKAIGINRLVHYKLGNFAERDKLGEILAPREPWGDWGNQLKNTADEINSGLVSIAMKQGTNLSDRKHGHIEVRVEPSAMYQNDGVFVTVNDHYQLSDNDPSKENGSNAAELIAKQFELSITRSESLIDNIMSLTKP